MPFGHGGGYPLNDPSSTRTVSRLRQSANTPGGAPSQATVNPLALRLSGPPDISPATNRDGISLTGGATDAEWGMDGVGQRTNGNPAPNGEAGPKSRQPKRPNPLPLSSKKTGLCYDVRMRYHATVDATDMHPEDPRRIYEIYKALCQAGLVDDPSFKGAKKQDDLMLRIDAREVMKEEALMIHTEEHWEFLTRTQDLSLEELQHLTLEGDSVYFNSESFFCSRLSCGGAIETCKAVMKGDVKNAIAVIRPPGHHAEPHKAMGFCLFNNVCVAAKAVQQSFPECKKVLILDWDVHHGNGTQTAFYDNPRVLYMSIHRYQGGKFYPEGPQGNLDYCGEGDGLGMNVNIPWPTGGMGDGDYMYAFQKVIMPIALEYNPDLVIVSAGFDAAAGDALGGCFVTPAGYAHMTHMLMSLADGKVVVCLEGGYNLQSISNSALAVTKVLMGEPPGRLHDGDIASRSAVDVVHQCVTMQSKYWRSMLPRTVLSDGLLKDSKVQTERLHDVIRSHQSRKLFEGHNMTPLAIFRDRISASFENQVLGTPDYIGQDTIVFFVHDPPPIAATSDPHTNRIALHDAVLVDTGMMYIDWAIKQGYGVIDVNIPQALTGENNDDYDVVRQTEELCVYMWDNYLELSEARNIILIGVGEAVVGLTHLLAFRGKTVLTPAGPGFDERRMSKQVTTSIGDDQLQHWYYNNSKVFVAHNHIVWERQKIKKKFGNLERSDAVDIHEIMRTALPAIREWTQEKIPKPPVPNPG